MRKFILVLLLFFCFFSLSFGKSYGYGGCDSYSVFLDGVSSLNYDSYLSSYRDIYSYCSLDVCIGSISGDVRENIDYLVSVYTDGMVNGDVVKMKGIPITKLVVNNCK